MTIIDFRPPITRTFVVAPLFIAFLTLVIPLVTIYLLLEFNKHEHIYRNSPYPLNRISPHSPDA